MKKVAEMAFTKEFWGTSSKRSALTDREKKLKKICDDSSNNEEFREKLGIWKKEVMPKETPESFYGRCYIKALRGGWLKEEIRKRKNWLLDLSPKRQEEFKEAWYDFSQYPDEISLLKKFPEAVNIRGLQRGGKEHSKPSLSSRTELKRKVAKEKKKEPQKIEPPMLVRSKWSSPPVLEISKEAWERPGVGGKPEVRVGAISRIDWKTKGARAGIIAQEFEIFVKEGCHYNALNGGLVDKKYVEARVKEFLGAHPVKQRNQYHDMIVGYVLQEIAGELNSVIPFIKKPANSDKPDETEFVRLYIMTSLVLDGKYGEKVAFLLQQMRPDIRLYKQGGDRTRLKGVGITSAEKRKGQEIGWINPKRPRLPGQYASTGMDSDIRVDEESAESFPALWVHGGHGSSVSKPGGGERKHARISLPISHVPLAGKPGEPSIALNQIGPRIIHASLDGREKLIETWSLRDSISRERQYVTGIKTGSNEVHKKIVAAIKDDEHRRGLHVGELSDILDIPRTTVEREISFLVEPKALERTTWPGLYKDVESGRYNFHIDWFQEKLRYPSMYDGLKDSQVLRRLVFGCLHAGYNTTDYEYVRRQFPEIINRFSVNVVELVGDIIAGLKHNMVHRGDIIGNINYTEQEIFAAELLGTVFFEVFVKRFEKLRKEKELKPSTQEIEQWIKSSLVLFLYIIGNHDAWQKDFGHTPGVVFRLSLLNLLTLNIGKYLWENGEIYLPQLFEIIKGKVVELTGMNATFTFPGDICAELVHPGMARTKTLSIRAEESLEFSDCSLVDIANFHTSVAVEKWGPRSGQRVATQVGAITPWTAFENTKLKIVDFGPVFSEITYREGRIFRVRHQFFHEPLIKTPISKNTDIDRLKDQLKLLRAQL